MALAVLKDKKGRGREGEPKRFPNRCDYVYDVNDKAGVLLLVKTKLKGLEMDAGLHRPIVTLSCIRLEAISYCS